MATGKKADVPPIPTPPSGVPAASDVPTPTEAPPVPSAAALPAVPPPAPAAPAAVNPYATPNPYESYPYQVQPAGPPQGLSIAAMVCGLVGLLGSFMAIGFLPALAGVIIGHIALKRQPHAKGFSVTGLATGYAGIAISLIWGLFILVATILPILLLATTS